MENSTIIKSFKEAQNCLDRFIASSKNMESVLFLSEKIAETIMNGNKIISCGNGGSMCDAMHFAEELTGRFRSERIPLPALSISDPSHITCVGNDYGFASVFSRYIEGVGVKGDLLLTISTSGNSPNLLQAIQSAKKKEIFSFSLLGKDGGKMKALTNNSIIAPGNTSDRIQEIHIKIIHIVIETVENILKEKKIL
jgi:D-sedoheptulose 7-phosphate isomerase